MLRWLGRYVCFSSVSKKYFGHVHSGPRSHTGLDLPRLKTLFTFQYDVGVDNNEYRPISFSQLCEIFKTQAQKAGGQKVEASSIMPSGMPIVFLDVDGVLVSDPTTRQAAVAPSSHLSWLLRESGAGLVNHRRLGSIRHRWAYEWASQGIRLVPERCYSETVIPFGSYRAVAVYIRRKAPVRDTVCCFSQ